MTQHVPAPLLDALGSARRIVAFTGAGMSAESGIPTFRDRGTGLWARFDPQALATPEAFLADPEMVWAWYEWRRKKVARAAPNAGHEALAQLATAPHIERLSVVTQNVDNLHERAGSTSVLHLHGSIFSPRCFDCAAAFTLPPDGDAGSESQAPVERLAPPRCAHCGGLVRPGVVWFGEMLPEQTWRQALQLAAEADLMLVIGTSGLVQPAASLPAATRAAGGQVAVINPDPQAFTGANSPLDWQVTAAVGLPALVRVLSQH